GVGLNITSKNVSGDGKKCRASGYLRYPCRDCVFTLYINTKVWINNILIPCGVTASGIQKWAILVPEAIRARMNPHTLQRNERTAPL
ncbi:hypothetical protein, partial [Enterobacter ludwigii]